MTTSAATAPIPSNISPMSAAAITANQCGYAVADDELTFKQQQQQHFFQNQQQQLQPAEKKTGTKAIETSDDSSASLHYHYTSSHNNNNHNKRQPIVSANQSLEADKRKQSGPGLANNQTSAFKEHLSSGSSNIHTHNNSSNNNYQFRYREELSKMRERLFRMLSKVPIQVETVVDSLPTPSQLAPATMDRLNGGAGSSSSSSSSSAAQQPKLVDRGPLLIKYYNERALSDILELHFGCSLIRHNYEQGLALDAHLQEERGPRCARMGPSAHAAVCVGAECLEHTPATIYSVDNHQPIIYGVQQQLQYTGWQQATTELGSTVGLGSGDGWQLVASSHAVASAGLEPKSGPVKCSSSSSHRQRTSTAAILKDTDKYNPGSGQRNGAHRQAPGTMVATAAPTKRRRRAAAMSTAHADNRQQQMLESSQQQQQQASQRTTSSSPSPSNGHTIAGLTIGYDQSIGVGDFKQQQQRQISNGKVPTTTNSKLAASHSSGESSPASQYAYICESFMGQQQHQPTMQTTGAAPTFNQPLNGSDQYAHHHQHHHHQNRHHPGQQTDFHLYGSLAYAPQPPQPPPLPLEASQNGGQLLAGDSMGQPALVLSFNSDQHQQAFVHQHQQLQATNNHHHNHFVYGTTVQHQHPSLNEGPIQVAPANYYQHHQPLIGADHHHHYPAPSLECNSGTLGSGGGVWSPHRLCAKGPHRQLNGAEPLDEHHHHTQQMIDQPTNVSLSETSNTITTTSYACGSDRGLYLEPAHAPPAPSACAANYALAATYYAATDCHPATALEQSSRVGDGDMTTTTMMTTTAPSSTLSVATSTTTMSDHHQATARLSNNNNYSSATNHSI